MKPIRMGDGKLRHIPYDEKKKRQKSAEEKRLGKWQGVLFMGLRSGITLGQCSGIFHRAEGSYPHPSWPGVCERGDADWKRAVAEVLDARKIARGCALAAARIRSMESQ